MGPSEGITLNSKKILYHDFLNDIFFFLHRFSKKVLVLLIVVCIFTWWRVWFLQLTHTNTKKQQQTYIVCIVKSLLMSQIHSPLGSFASRIAGNNNIHPHHRSRRLLFWNYIESDEHCQWYRWWIRLIEFRNGTSRKDFFLFILPVWSWDSSEILPKITEFLINRILHH